MYVVLFFFFQAEDGIRDIGVTGVQTCALPIYRSGWQMIKNFSLRHRLHLLLELLYGECEEIMRQEIK